MVLTTMNGKLVILICMLSVVGMSDGRDREYHNQMLFFDILPPGGVELARKIVV